MKWKTKVGVEVHAKILSAHKLFSAASARTLPIHAPNSHTAFHDLALPGSLPVLNKFCLFQAARAGCLLNGKVNTRSVFERKHYFYADLPGGFQVTQQRSPVVTGGSLHVDVQHFCHIHKLTSADTDRASFFADIERVQLENDTGETVGDNVDYNRMGCALLETVTSPCFFSAIETCAFIYSYLNQLKFMGISQGDLSKGDLMLMYLYMMRKEVWIHIELNSRI